MNHTQQIIQDAIEGGWRTVDDPKDPVNPERMFLNPLFWQAAGKTRGWGEEPNSHITLDGESKDLEGWKLYWLKFIDHLAEGKSYEEALSKIV